MRFTWRHALVFIVCLAPFFYAMGFVFPGGDDYLFAAKARYLGDVYEGFHGMFRGWWKWSGRYTHQFLAFCFGDAVTSQFTYTASCWALALVFGIGFAGLFASLTRPVNRAGWLVPALMALFTVYGGFQYLPVAYLYTDCMSLWISSGLLVWFAWGLCRLWHAAAPGRSHVLFPAVSGVLAVGSYEHSALAGLLMALSAWGLALYCRHPHERLFRKVCLTIGVAFALMFFARGNFRRQTKRGVELAQIYTQLLRAGADWRAAMAWLPQSVYPFAALMLAVAVSPRRRPDVRPLPAGLWCAWGLAFVLLLSVGIVLVHALSDVTVNMTPKLPANLALLCGMVLCAVLIAVAGPLRAVRDALPAWLASWLIVVLAAGGIIWSSPNTLTVLTQLSSGRMEATRKENAARMRVAERAAGSTGILEVAPLSPVPYPLSDITLGPDAHAWPNPQFCELYGLTSARAVWHEPELEELESRIPAPDYIPGIGQAGLARATAGPNETYAAYWLILRPERPLGSVSVLLAPETESSRFFPREAQRLLLGLPNALTEILPGNPKLAAVFDQSALTASFRTRLVGYTREFSRADSLEPWLLPVHPLSGGLLRALYVSADGKEYRRIRLP